MFNFKDWVEQRKSIVKKTGGLEEKNEATERKMQVAMKILAMPDQDRRKAPFPVEVERRVELYDYHQKLV